MKFWEAMHALEEGKRVRRSDWDSNKWIARDSCDCGGKDCWIYHMREDNFSTKEWELYEDPAQTFSFAEVVKGLKEGKRFKRKNWSDVDGIQASRVDDVRWVADGKMFSLNLQDVESIDWIEIK